MLRGYIEVLVKDKDGRIVRYGRHEMKSLLNNFLKMVEGTLKAGGDFSVTVSVTDTGGASKTAYAEYYSTALGSSRKFTPLGCKAPDNDDTFGIIVGSGTGSVALDNYSLVSKISHGTGSGQLDYDPVIIEDLGLDQTVSPPVYRYRLSRGFKNLSGAALNINEVGIVARNYVYEDAVLADVRMLIGRDVLPTTYTVPNGGSATVAITVEVEVG
jgi:hypothetical protein